MWAATGDPRLIDTPHDRLYKTLAVGCFANEGISTLVELD